MKKTGTDIAVLLLRVMLALIFIPHGWSKVMGNGGVAAFVQDLPSYGIPTFLGYLAAWSELAGAILLLAGLLTRIDAFLLACTMGVATFVVQLPDALREVQPGANRYFAAMHGIELPFALLAAALAVVILGPGRLSLDFLIVRGMRTSRPQETRSADETSAPHVSSSTAPAPR
jgi:putative oxidoreductase